MFLRILFYLGIIIVLLALVLLLLGYLFIRPSGPAEVGQLIVRNPVDTSIQPELVEEAASFIAGLIEAAESASTQAELDQVMDAAEAQSGLISTAATGEQQLALTAAIEAASVRLEAAAATPTPTATPSPTSTATAVPTNTSTPTVEPAPPDSLPVTGNTNPSIVPTVVIEVNWPAKMAFKQSQTLYVILTQLTEGEYELSVRPDVTSEVITATPAPVPDSTPQVPIQNAYGDRYSSYAVAELQIDKEALGVTEPSEVRASLDNPRISWEWVLKPTVSGKHDAIVRIFAEWEPVNSDERKPARVEIFEETVTINVAPPPLIERGPITSGSVFLALFGTLLSLVSKFIENRMEKDRSTGVATG